MEPTETGSPAFSFSGEDVKKVLIGTLVAAAGAALTYVTEWATATDFGIYTPMVVAGLSVLTNIARKYLFNTQA